MTTTIKTHWLACLLLVTLLGGLSSQTIAQNKATAQMIAEYNTLATKYQAKPKNKPMEIKVKEVKRMAHIHGVMSPAQRSKAVAFPTLPPPPPPAYKPSGKKATAKTIAEYNALAKKYQAQPKNKKVVDVKEVKRMKQIYKTMTPAQRSKAVGFPVLPPAPPKK